MTQLQHLPAPQNDPLMQPIYLNGQEYRTSHFLHRTYLANSEHGAKYPLHQHFIRVLKGLETYQLYIQQGDILVFPSSKDAFAASPNLGEANENKALRDAFRALSHRTLYLVNATIQVALSHHLDDAIDKQLSVATNTATARQLTGKGMLPPEIGERSVRSWLALGDLFGTPKHIVLIEAVKQVRKDHDLDLEPLLLGSTAMNDIPEEETMLEPSKLAKALKYGDSKGVKMNEFLRQIGWQTRNQRAGTWHPTPAGQPYATRHAWTNHGQSGYNLKWKLEAVRNELHRRGMLPKDAA